MDYRDVVDVLRSNNPRESVQQSFYAEVTGPSTDWKCFFKVEKRHKNKKKMTVQ